MDRLFDDSRQHPGEYLKEKLNERGWTYDELGVIAGKSTRSISEIARCKAGVSAEMAHAFGAAFGNSPEEWLKWDYLYRLSTVTSDVSPVEDMARLYALAPVRDMQRRGWIKTVDTAEGLAEELKRFFENDTLDQPCFPVALRKAAPLAGCNAAERAWCFRAKKLASALNVKPFRRSKVKEAVIDLRVLAAFPKEASEVPKVLSEYGIRFIVVEPLPGCKIDGAAFWLDESAPVIAVSVRFDRNDSFWFTVMHELMHIVNKDALSIDTDLVGDQHDTVLVEDEIEVRANKGAADALIPHQEIDSFIRRVGPLYSKQRIIQFSHRVKIHPAIVVGQLQNRKEIGYHSNREMFAKIRSTIVDTALTDGWGRTVEIQL